VFLLELEFLALLTVDASSRNGSRGPLSALADQLPNDNCDNTKNWPLHLRKCEKLCLVEQLMELELCPSSFLRSTTAVTRQRPTRHQYEHFKRMMAVCDKWPPPPTLRTKCSTALSPDDRQSDTDKSIRFLVATEVFHMRAVSANLYCLQGGAALGHRRRRLSVILYPPTRKLRTSRRRDWIVKVSVGMSGSVTFKKITDQPAERPTGSRS
jgi:hypothetical protein